MINPTPHDVGRKVIGKTQALSVLGTGIIDEVTPRFVFVRWEGGSGQQQATHKENLNWKWK